MSIAGIGLLLWILLSFIKFLGKPKKLFLRLLYIYVFCSVFLRTGIVFSTNNYDIDYSEVSLIFLFLYSVILLFSGNFRMYSKYIINYFLFEIFFIVAFIARIVSKVEVYGVSHNFIIDEVFYGSMVLENLQITSYSIITFIRVSIFLFEVFILLSNLTKYELKAIVKKLFIPSCLIVVLGILEFILINLIDPYSLRNFVVFLLGKSKNMVIVPYYRAGIYSILLTCQEPSVVSSLLFIVSFIFLSNLRFAFSNNKKIFIIVMIIFSQLLSLSTLSITGLMYFFILLLFVLLNLRNKVLSSGIFVSFIFLFFLFISLANDEVLSYFNTRFSTLFEFVKAVFNGTSEYFLFSNYGGSLVFRFYSMVIAFNNFLQSPFVGLGLGTATSFSGLFYTLADVGIIGLVLIIYLWYSVVIKIAKKKKSAFSIIILLLFSFLFYGGLSDFLYTINTYVVLVCGLVYVNHSSVNDKKVYVVANKIRRSNT